MVLATNTLGVGGQNKERHSNGLTFLWLIRQNDKRSDKKRHSNVLTFLWLIRQNDKRSDVRKT